MATVPPPAGAPAPRPTLQALAQKQQVLGFVLLGAAAALMALPIYLGVRYKFDQHVPFFLWGVASALTLLGVGISCVVAAAPADPEQAAEGVRFRLLLLGGVLGLLATVLGFVLPFTEPYSGVFGGDLRLWRRNPWALIWTGLALFGGLVLMLLSLQLARGYERSSTAMRRLLYGYNAVLGGVLLLAVLGLVNLLAYTRVGPFKFFTRTFDWTSAGVYSLSDSSRNLLTSLEKPVKVYVLLPQRDRTRLDMETLLENCRAVNPKLTWEGVSPDRDPETFTELVSKYPIDRLGLLVLYGTAPDVQWDFVRGTELSENNPSEGEDRRRRYTFLGEDALMKSITLLTEGKTKPAIYFTQGSGEPAVTGFGRGGLSVLRDQLTRSNFEVRELTFGEDGKAKGVPEDAAVVVVARPTRRMDKEAVQALRDYVGGKGRKAKGKLVVLLDAPSRLDESKETGLEGLLAEYGVKVGNDRVLQRSFPPPTRSYVTTSPRSANEVARAFIRGDRAYVFTFDQLRTVAPAGAGGKHRVEALLQTLPQQQTWVENDLAATPNARLDFYRNPENLEKWLAARAKEPVTVGVAVTEGADVPMMPGHPPVGGTPRMVVVGSAAWVGDDLLNGTEYNDDLFINCLNWLRERPQLGQLAKGKDMQDYRLPRTENVSRAKYLPLLLMLLAVVGVAGGVWVVRRR